MTSPSFLVDECLPFQVTQALRDHHLDADDIVERGFRGLSDEGVWTLAAKESRVLVTRDLDFPLRIAGPRPAGMVLLRAPDLATAQMLSDLVGSLLDSVAAHELVGHLTVVSAGRFRQRPW